MREKMNRFVVLLLILSSFAACKSNSLTDPNYQPEWYKETSEYKELPNSIGDISSVHEADFELSGPFNEGLSNKTEYGRGTDKWFDTGFSISAGTVLPGEEVDFRLYEPPENLTYRYQLTERSPSLERIQVIKEEISTNYFFRAKLPEKDGALYLLSVEILGENNQVEDTLLSLVGVPVQSINAMLYTDKQTYEGDTVTLKLKNFGPTALYFGAPYYIEKYEDNEWRRIIFKNTTFTSIGITLNANEVYEQSVKLWDLPEGKYRIVKDIGGKGTELEATLATEFEVKIN